MTLRDLLGRSTRNRSRSAPLPFWAWCTVAMFCTALYTVTVPLTSAEYQLDLAVAFTVATVQCGSLVVAVSRPILGSVLQLVSVVALALATASSDGDPWPLPITGFVSLGALVLLLGIRERWIVSSTVWWVSVVALVAVIATSPSRYELRDEWGENLTVYAGFTAVVLIAAIAVGQRHRIRADLAEARRDVELEHARRLYVEERGRIARELHDVVAHSMSLIHMQALSAPYRLADAEPATVHAEFDAIARSARTALAEMRQMLGALRSDDDDAELAPQPQLTDLPTLVDATSAAGSPVQLHVDEQAAATTSTVQLTTYRIVQEALSNVVRHAPGATASVSATVEGTTLRIRVCNGPPAAGSQSADHDSPDRGGQGIRGMRERIQFLGGQLTARPTAEGGFLVEAAIPVTTDSGAAQR